MIQRFSKRLKKRLMAIRLGKKDVERHVRRNSGNPALNFLRRVPAPWEYMSKEEYLPEGLKKV